MAGLRFDTLTRTRNPSRADMRARGPRPPRRPLMAIAVAALGAAGACGHSSLLRRDDPAPEDSQRRLAATAAAVEVSGAPPVERLLFMQAEGFHRYRFQAPRPSVASTAAVVAAVITELPAFQALAGSLDLDDLRVR